MGPPSPLRGFRLRAAGAAARQVGEAGGRGWMGRTGWRGRMGRIGRIGRILSVLALLVVQPSAQATPPDTILVNGQVVTVDARFSIAQAVAIAGSKFTAVGTSADIRKLAGPSTAVIDLKGRTMIPGLADDHLHDAGGGPGVDLSRTRSLAEVLAAIAARVKQSRPGDIVITNSDWHEAQLKEHRLPYRRDLDSVAPDNPVVVVRGGHEYILNSAALKKWNIDRATPQVPGGRITRDARGELNGELIDRAKSLVQLPPGPALTIERLQEQHRQLNAAGLTSIRYPGASVEQYRLLQDMRRRGLLTVRINQLLRFGVDSAAAMRSALAASSIKPDEGDDWLRIGGVKLAVDGGFEGGWMREAYAEPWGEGGTFR